MSGDLKKIKGGGGEGVETFRVAMPDAGSQTESRLKS